MSILAVDEREASDQAGTALDRGGALYLISDNELYQPETIKPQDMGDLEILGRCEILIGRVV